MFSFFKKKKEDSVKNEEFLEEENISDSIKKHEADITPIKETSSAIIEVVKEETPQEKKLWRF